MPAPRSDLLQDFRFAILASNDCTSNRLRWSGLPRFFIPSDYSDPRTGQLWLRRVRKNLEVPHFKRFVIHFSVLSLPRPVRFLAAPYPVGKGSAAIRRTMAWNRRRVRWLPASNSQ